MSAMKTTKNRVVVDFFWNNVVIGSDLDAVEFAHDNNYFLIKNRRPYHHSYGGSEPLWAEKSYQLYNRGLCAFTDKVQVLRVDPKEKIIKVFTESAMFLVRYSRLHLFDTDNVSGVSMDRQLLYYRVLDWFDCKGLYDLPKDRIITDDDFVNKIVFFKTPRIDGDQKYLDLLCESFLTEEQLKNFDYSDTMARLKTVMMLKEYCGREVEMKLWKRDVYPVYKCPQRNT
jgi:hypothetical protein